MSEVAELLNELKRADRNLEGGPEIENRVITAFRRRRAQRVWGRTVLITAAIAAVIVLAALPPRPQSARVERRDPPADALPAAGGSEGSRTAPLQKKSILPHRRFTHAELATDFFPLLDTPPPFERGELLRVVVPAATMLQVGLPVSQEHWADPVRADILVGEEGLARAIRFWNYAH